MHLSALVIAFASAASAVTHYGLQPDDDFKSQIESHAQELEAQGLSLTSVFRTDEHGTHDGADFLGQEMGIFNKTIAEYFTSSGNIPEAAGNTSQISSRAPKLDSTCTGHGNIEDHLSDGQITATCGAIAGAAVGSVNQIIAVVENKFCVEAGTGHPLPPCKAIVGFVKDSQGPLTGAIIGKYCPDFMSLFTKCKAKTEARSHEHKKIEMAAWATQKDLGCKPDTEGEHCIEPPV